MIWDQKRINQTVCEFMCACAHTYIPHAHIHTYHEGKFDKY